MCLQALRSRTKLWQHRSRASMAGKADKVTLTGLVGRDIAASRSPWLHEQEAMAQGINLRYDLLDFAKLGQDEGYLPIQLQLPEKLGYAGINVTYPYKQSIIPHLHSLAPGASRVGAVNTVQFANGRRIGYNTDVTGFAQSLRSGLPQASLRNVLQLGAGGAGAATAMALLELGTAALFVNDRETYRANELVQRLCAEFGPNRAVRVDDTAAALRGVDGLVNATPMGMSSHPEAPIATALLDPRQWVADIVYFPLETRLLREARERGCVTLDGSGMAVHQAAAAFEIFTGLKPDVTRMLKSFLGFPQPAPGKAALGAEGDQVRTRVE
jgi:shikimate dehydrogenase